MIPIARGNHGDQLWVNIGTDRCRRIPSNQRGLLRGDLFDRCTSRSFHFPLGIIHFPLGIN